MYLDVLIKKLEEVDPEIVLRNGFHNPHSWRGDYYELAFEPKHNVKVKHMLKDARSAIGATYTGWKGGEYTMDEYSNVYLAEEGCMGEELGPLLFDYMLKDVVE